MATSITFDLQNDDETKPIILTHARDQSTISSPTKIFKPFPSSIIHSIEADRRKNQRTTIPQSTSEFIIVTPPSVDLRDDSGDDDDDNDASFNENTRTKLAITVPDRTRTRALRLSRRHRSPSEVRLNLYSNETLDAHENLTNSQLEVSKGKYKNQLRSSDPTLLERTKYKPNRTDYFRRVLLEHRVGRRIHSAYSSSATLRSLTRRRSAQNLLGRKRRSMHRLPPNSKWHTVRNRLHDIAMMSESYARMKSFENDLRWKQLGERIHAQVLDLRDMSLLRQQDDGVKLKKNHKTKFDLKAIPINEIIHIERDGRVYSMGTRDLVLGRLLSDDAVDLDAFAQLDARRLFQVQQHLLKQQEGRTRLKKHIAFSFCLCNLSFIVIMFAAMLIFALKTILELR